MTDEDFCDCSFLEHPYSYLRYFLYLLKQIKLKTMKSFLSIIVALACMITHAQTVMNITYIDVPREQADEFLELHVKFSNLSMSDERKLTGHGIFTHAFAGDYTFALYDFYASAADIDADADLANEVLQKNVKAMELDDEAQQAMNEQYFKYFRMYAENHTDQIRIVNEDVFYESDFHDWTTTKVVTVGKYGVKWGQGSAFRDAWNAGQFENYKNDEGVTAVYGTNHLYGSGLGLHIYTFYKDWNAFAAFETANFGQPMDDNGRAFWSAVDAHEDEILVWIGGLNDETKEVYLVN
tara:strand:- start:777 stop:1661 length:885 start_codon:yes stop_codon:yes gene_type:complete